MCGTRYNHHVRWALFALVPAIRLFGQNPICEPAPAVRTALDRVQSSGRDSEQRFAAAAAARTSFPADYFANAVYQDMSGSPVSPAVQAEYGALRDRHPDDRAS